MAGNSVFVVFLFPAVISVFLGTMVMAEVLKEPNRELNMWQFGTGGVVVQSGDIKITGLQKQYAASESVEIEVSVRDLAFDCGDLYITIYDISKTPKQVITQSGYFEQCFAANNLPIPIEDEFSEKLDAPGKYEILVTMNDKQYQNTISVSQEFLVE